MKTIFLLFVCFLFVSVSFGQGESFLAKEVLNQKPVNPADRYKLRHPFGLVYGPDDSLWISERRGRVIKVDPVSGMKRDILNIGPSVKFTNSGTSIKQDGMMGLVLHPDYPFVDSFFIAYAYDNAGVTKVRITEYAVKNYTITTRAGNERIIIENLPAGVDHSAGRLITGPDRKLYYSIGDLGANQFALRCNPNRAQDVPTAAELTAKNYIAYQGKVLRINLDGSIPADNPIVKGIKSHIYTFGHRNPNSLVFAKNGQQQDFLGAKLYSAENGPAEDDEINQLIAGKNYGWPYYSGYRDDKIYQYKNWSSAPNCSSYPAPGSEPECSTAPPGTIIMNETDTLLPNAVFPMRAFFTPTTGSIACSWLSNPTVAPASIAYYGFDNRIPGWQNSILMSTLKEGTVFRLKLSADGNSFVSLPNGSDTARYFREENRLRDIAIGKDGISFYIITDSVGQTSGPTTGNPNQLNDRGAILKYVYNGAVLSIDEPVDNPQADRLYVKIYPIPASQFITVESKRNIAKPIQYHLYNTIGSVVKKGTSARDVFTIATGGLPSGLYILELRDGHDIKFATQKLIIQK